MEEFIQVFTTTKKKEEVEEIARALFHYNPRLRGRSNSRS